MKMDMNRRAVNIEDLTENLILRKWLKLGLDQYSKLPSVKDFIHNYSEAKILERLMQLWKDFETFGIDNVNDWSMREELFHFSGMQLNNDPIITEAAQKMVKFVKHYLGKPKDKPKKD